MRIARPSRHESAEDLYGRLAEVTNVLPAEDAAPAQWLLQPDTDWWDLVRYGPPGFDVYMRIAFPEDDDGDDAVRAALAILAS